MQRGRNDSDGRKTFGSVRSGGSQGGFPADRGADKAVVKITVDFSPVYRDQFEILAQGIYAERITGNLILLGNEVDRDRFGHDKFDVTLGGKKIYTRTLRPYMGTPRVEDVVLQVRNHYLNKHTYEIDRCA